MRIVFLGRDRRPWRLAALNLATLGILRRVWLFRVNKEIDGHEALGLNHKANAAMLWAAAAGALLALAVVLAGLDTVWYLAAWLCLLPTSWVQLRTAQRAHAMLGSAVKHGLPGAIWAASLVPIAGPMFFLVWEQGRLNRFWAHERKHPGRGLEVDVELGADPAFLVELDEARRASYHAGSRFERRRQRRRQRWAGRAARLKGVQAERAAVREAGGSVPVVPFVRPKRPRSVRLAITCGRCQTRFAVVRDPTRETPVVCPKCSLAEVLPALWENPLGPKGAAAVPTLEVTCPKCATKFRAVHNLAGPTVLHCPSCGREDTLPAGGGKGSPA